MDQQLIDSINSFAIESRTKPERACAKLGLTQEGHDKVLYCWITEELETPQCLYEFISLCTKNPKRSDLGATEWWKTRQKHFSEGMGYLYGINEKGQAFAPEITRAITPAIFGDASGISTIEPNCYGGIGDKLWRWLEQNSGGTGWIAQGKITKRFQNIAKASELMKLLDDWLKEGKIEHQKFMPVSGRTANLYRIKEGAKNAHQ